MELLKAWFRNRSSRVRPRRGRLHRARPAAAEWLEDRLLLAFDIELDYRYDTGGFFSSQQRRDVLEAVAGIYESRITDDLTAITPGGVNSWTAVFADPTTGSQVNLNNLSVAADTVIVFVGARNLGGSLGIGGPGGFNSFATPEFNQNLQTRGESGVNPNGTNDTDFALWGGTITFTTNTTWNSSLDPPSAGQNDLFSVALHEMGHLLGVGTSESFSNLVNGSGQFTGSAAVAAFGGPVPLHGDRSHLASGTQSTLPGTAIEQEASMDPQITTGTRKQHTVLDWAVLEDVGWDIVPVAGPIDYGDAPDALAGTGPGNYNTREADNGPRHQVVPGLLIGTTVDGDDGSLQDANATADDLTGSADEDFTGSDRLAFVEGVAASISVNVTNTTASTATLYGWIDFNGDGVFSSGTESASVPVPAGTSNGTVTLSFPVPPVGSAGTTFARLRLSSDAAAAVPTGLATNGEVEDHSVTILTQTTAYDSLPLFTWSPVAGAVRYELEVNNLSTGQNQVILQSQLTTSSFRPPAALPAGTYSWRYRAHDGSGFLAWSPSATLFIFATSGTPPITDPVAGSIDSLPTIAWSPVAGATRYELWVNATGQDRVIHQTGLTGTSFTPSSGLAADTYTAWVRAYSGAAAISAWSPAFTFVLGTSTTSVLTDPIATSSNTLPTFGWLPTTSQSYTLRIDNLSTATTDVLVADQLTGTSFTPSVSLPSGSYSATIQAVGTAESAAVRFQIEPVSGQAEFTRPSGNSDNPLPVFAWTEVSGATRYEIWVDDVSRGISRILHSSSVFETSYAAPQPLSPGLYRAWVRAFGSSGSIGTWSTALDYRVTEASALPKVWEPSGTIDQAAPRFTWSQVSGATHYQVSFAFGPSGGTGTLPLTQQKVTSNSLRMTAAFEPGDYVVTVTAYGGSSILATAEQRFVVAPSGGAIQMYAPDSTVYNTRPIFTWSAVDNATRYILWVNDVGRSINAAILQNKLATAVYIPDSPLPPGDYRVWVRAYNGSTPVSSWSAGLNFTVAEVPGPPQVTLPLSNITNSVPTFTWTAVAGAAGYDIELDDLTTGQSAFQTATSIVSTSFRPTAAMLPGNYLVRVRSVDSGGTRSAWSDDLELTVEAATSASLVSPLAGSSTGAADLLFAWTTDATAVRYELWVNNLTTGRIQQIHETSLTEIWFVPSTSLSPGSYRAWVRGIAADNSSSGWSVNVEFTVVAAELDSAFDTELLNIGSWLLAEGRQPAMQIFGAEPTNAAPNAAESTTGESATGASAAAESWTGPADGGGVAIAASAMSARPMMITGASRKTGVRRRTTPADGPGVLKRMHAAPLSDAPPAHPVQPGFLDAVLSSVETVLDAV
ncbi:MAG: GEVED domain-containing protein [Fuerstiella sp.]